ncbi:MAG: M4 family metallopeptidase [Lachnospiraceae bacterium]|nr:M4 family metallopeptidase [Lachnospiraceae bacterium]
MALIQCPRCGNRVDDREGRCFVCGTELFKPVNPAAPAPRPEPVNPAAPSPRPEYVNPAVFNPAPAAPAPAKKKKTSKWPFILIFGILFVIIVTVLFLDFYNQSIQDGEEEEEAAWDELPDDPEMEDFWAEDDPVYTGEGAVQTFIGEPFYEGVVRDEEDALKAVLSVLDLAREDSSIHLECVAIQPIEDGTTYYAFRQMAGDVSVYGASVKLIADREGKAVGLVSSLVPNLDPDELESWAVDAIGAEAVVMDEYEGEGLKLYRDATEQILLPMEDGSDQFYYAWAVYSNNIFDDVDTAYLVHYVDESGEFLYSVPVSRPGSREAGSGGAAFAFESMEPDVWSGTVKCLDGTKKEIEIPVMKDPQTGEMILGDVERKILCADQEAFIYEDTLDYCTAKKGRWDDEAMLTYANFINIYDFYDTTGWDGPDGEGTPCLILVNAVEENGDPVENAYYSGRMEGFQVFEFDTTQAFGEAVDVMAHEYTHCFTTTAMTTNIYSNDYGAINEGMSDIMGNLAAIMTDETDEPYIIGEKIPDMLLRNMGDPNKGGQPAFVWDRYYLPKAEISTDNNDNGGVHTNSSLLNILSYRLHEAGMQPEDEFYFWMNVGFAMTPRSDFDQMLDILPWAMERCGYPEYVGVMKAALDETGLSDRSLPGVPPKDLGLLKIGLENRDLLEDAEVLCEILGLSEEGDYETYPEAGTGRIAATLPEGEYFIYLDLIREDSDTDDYYFLQENEWRKISEEELDELMDDAQTGASLKISKGQVVELDV